MFELTSEISIINLNISVWILYQHLKLKPNNENLLNALD